MEIGFYANNHVKWCKWVWDRFRRQAYLLTKLFAMSMESAYNGGRRDILGNTVHSAKTVVQKALDRLGIPQNSEEKKENFFYESFLRFLN